jgi:hypothetical protein
MNYGGAGINGPLNFEYVPVQRDKQKHIQFIMEVYKGWAIEYLIVTESDGTQWTPITPIPERLSS